MKSYRFYILIILIIFCTILLLSLSMENSAKHFIRYDNKANIIKNNVENEITRIDDVLKSGSILLSGLDYNDENVEKLLNSIYYLTTPTYDASCLYPNGTLIFSSLMNNSHLFDFKLNESANYFNSSCNNSTNETVITQYMPFDLFYGNISGIVIAEPIYLNNNFDGYVAVTVDLPSLIDKSIRQDPIDGTNDSFYYVINSKTQKIIYATNTCLIGENANISPIKPIFYYKTGHYQNAQNVTDIRVWNTISCLKQEWIILISTLPIDNIVDPHSLINNDNNDVLIKSLAYRSQIYIDNFGEKDATTAFNNSKGIFQIGDYCIKQNPHNPIYKFGNWGIVLLNRD